MKHLNKMMLIGNVGKEVEFKTMPNGNGVTEFSVATTDTWKDNSGTQQERTEWHNCVAYGKLAELVRDILNSGDPVYIEGSKRTRSWDGDNGKRYKVEIIVDEFSNLSQRQRQGQQSQGYQQAQPQHQGQQSQGYQQAQPQHQGQQSQGYQQARPQHQGQQSQGGQASQNQGWGNQQASQYQQGSATQITTQEGLKAQLHNDGYYYDDNNNCYDAQGNLIPF